MDRSKEITADDLQDYYEYRRLREEMDKQYRYKHWTQKTIASGCYVEAVDTLQTIIYKQAEGWIEKVELIEEV